MIWNQIKTVILLGSMTGLLFLLGHFIGGTIGVHMALILAFIMNFTAYFYSDKMVLAMYRAQKLDEKEFAWIYEMVAELCQESRLPMPKLWYIPTSMPNAFATGRNPKHASVAVTQGILNLLDRHELRGVLAHEVSHIKNRDILVSTIAATIAAAIGYVGYMLRWSSMWVSNDRRERSNPLGMLLAGIFVPIAATLIQLAVSRSREYLADESGAQCSGDPLSLAEALEKIEIGVKQKPLDADSPAYTSTASLFIMNPFKGGGFVSLFSTHPPTAERIKRLRNMAGRYR